VDDQYTSISVMVFLYWNSVTKALMQPSLYTPRLSKGGRTHNLPRAAVCNTEDDRTTTLVGEGYAIVHQFLKMEIVQGCLEFEASAFRGVDPRLKLS
jgi:hypothetical protein